MLVRPFNNWLLLFFSTSQVLNTKNKNENGIFCKVFFTEVRGGNFQNNNNNNNNNLKNIVTFLLKIERESIICTSSLLLDSFYKKIRLLGCWH
jgi:hypothetical protein